MPVGGGDRGRSDGPYGNTSLVATDIVVLVDARSSRVSPRVSCANTDRLTVRADTSANAPIAVGGRCDDCLQNYARLTLEPGWQEITILFEEFGGGTHPSIRVVAVLLGFRSAAHGGQTERQPAEP